MTGNTNSDPSKAKISSAFERKESGIVFVGWTPPDQLALFLDCRLEPVEADPPKRQAIVSALNNVLRQVPEQLRERESIQDAVRLLAQGKGLERYLVAKGVAAQAGEDGKIVLLVRKYDGNKGGVRFDSVEPNFVSRLNNVNAETAVARVYPPGQGKAGTDVFGKQIAAKAGQSAKVMFDRSIRLEPGPKGESYQNLVAQIDGFLAEEERRLCIKPVLALGCDIGPRTGNIEFVGEVVTNGSLMKGVRVSARGSVRIARDSLNGYISSSKGGIAIGGSAYGVIQSAPAGSESMVSSTKGGELDFRCAGDFSAGAVQGVRIDAGGNISIIREASHSWLSCRGALKMENAHLFGCEVYVSQGVFVKKVGSKSGSPTVIHLAESIRATSEYREIKEEMAKSESAKNMLLLHLGPYAKDPERLINLSPAHRKRMDELLGKLHAVQKSLSELKLRLEELEAIGQFEGVLCVNVFEAFYRGSVIQLGDKLFVPDTDLIGARKIEFDPSAGEFKLGEVRRR